VGEFRDLSDEVTVSDDTERPGLLIPAGGRKARGLKHILNHFLGNWFLLEFADTGAVLQ
jgi:hypothetical protein